MKKVGQMRFYSENNANNYPSTLTIGQLRHGTAFSKVYPIVKLGIQTVPGTKFYVNGHDTPVIVGHTGIYQIDLDGVSTISDLAFDYASLNVIALNDNVFLQIDYVYETEG